LVEARWRRPSTVQVEGLHPHHTHGHSNRDQETCTRICAHRMHYQLQLMAGFDLAGRGLAGFELAPSELEGFELACFELAGGFELVAEYL
jgi:hypothetical protein